MASIIENCCFITETQTMFSTKQQKQNLSKMGYRKDSTHRLSGWGEGVLTVKGRRIYIILVLCLIPFHLMSLNNFKEFKTNHM